MTNPKMLVCTYIAYSGIDKHFSFIHSRDDNLTSPREHFSAFHMWITEDTFFIFRKQLPEITSVAKLEPELDLEPQSEPEYYEEKFILTGPHKQREY